jgi:uncharacterized hydrophobic protein (TIGR00271 family)
MATAEAGLVHLRLSLPSDVGDSVIDELEQSPAVANLARLRDASVKPPGDLVLCDVAREEVSVVVDRLRRLGVGRIGSISIDEIDSMISEEGRRAVVAARGSPADAVIWEEVEAKTSESAELSFGFVIFMVLATLIAAIGILTDSVILIIGAMVVGPEFGPLAGICVALVEQRLELARRSALALLVGFPVAIAYTTVAVLILRATGTAPDQIATEARSATFFISHPDTFSVLVALIAGVVGLLSLTTAKSGALVGVLISVTTIPAAGNVAVATAYRDWSEFRGALAQLGINLTCIVVGGVATLLAQRVAYTRRLGRSG